MWVDYVHQIHFRPRHRAGPFACTGVLLVDLDLIRYVIAAVCFALAAFGVGGRINLLAAGLFAWVLTNIF